MFVFVTILSKACSNRPYLIIFGNSKNAKFENNTVLIWHDQLLGRGFLWRLKARLEVQTILPLTKQMLRFYRTANTRVKWKKGNEVLKTEYNVLKRRVIAKNVQQKGKKRQSF